MLHMFAHYYAMEVMLWKCTFCSFTFPFSSCSDKEFAELFDFGNSNLFYSAMHKFINKIGQLSIYYSK